MVTTNSSEEVICLFEEAARAARQLVTETDQEESVLIERACQLTRLAVRAVTPVLKYVDYEVSTYKGKTRGVVFSFDDVYGSREDLIVTGQGQIGHWDVCDVELFANCNASVRADVVLTNAKGIITELGKIFRDAVIKIDERRQNLARRAEQLEAAAAVFKNK